MLQKHRGDIDRGEMAECMEVLDEAVLQEQLEEVTVLQSIFQEDLQIIRNGGGEGSICFNLMVSVNIPFERIDFEALIPIAVEERSVRACNSESDSDMESGCHGENSQESEAMGKSEGHSETHINGSEVSTVDGDEGRLGDDSSSPSGSAFLGRRKPGFTRSMSLQHWHVTADLLHLTPICLTCTFPRFYPAECPPEVSLSCLWLSKDQIQVLQEKLMNLWTETPNMPIIFTWADWLQNYGYQHLGLGPHLVLKEDERIVIESKLQTHMYATENGYKDDKLIEKGRIGTNLQTALLTIFEYDFEMQKREFRQTTHSCKICFDERNGTEFHYLDACRHFFCNECLKAHCELHVEGGTVLNLLCPNHDCKSRIPPEILREVLDAEKLERWERLLLSKTLDIMGDIVYCPRCNLAVVIDEDETSRLAHCANCYFAFCTECHQQWHPAKPCFREFSDSDMDDEEKSKKKSNKAQKRKNTETLDAAVRRKQRQQEEHRREMSSISFIRMMKAKGTYQYCPKCRMAVERISGCDMMHCSQCRTSFCWRCGK